MRAGCLDENTIDGFFGGKLSSAELTAIDAHIDTCSDCRVLLSSIAAHEVNAGPFSATLYSPGLEQEIKNESGPKSSLPPSSRLTAGDVLAGRFVVEGLVGAGGMAEVYRAHDRETDGKVAVKVTLGYGAEDRARFEREAKLLVQLSHTAIVKHTSNGRLPDETPFLAMEWLEGEDLAARLKRAPLTIAECLALGIRVSGALAAAHALGIIHRDVKPSNIFLKRGEVQGATVIDFGVARQAFGDGSLATRTGMLLGTLGYMAPEQALGAKTADARADVFSLGCVIFECVSGRRLFAGAHAVEVLAKLLTEPVPRLGSLAVNVPAALDDLVQRMLSRDPNARPADCATVARELVAIRAAGPDPIESVLPPAPRGEVARQPSRRSAAIGALLALAAFAVLATAGIAWKARSASPPPSLALATAAVSPSPSTPTSAVAPPEPTPAREAIDAAAPSPAAARVAADGSPPSAPHPRAVSPAHPADPFGNSRN